MAPIAAEIRARTQKMLRGGAAYEGARHSILFFPVDLPSTAV